MSDEIEKTDVLLIQPPVTQRKDSEEEWIEDYFRVMESRASYLGDASDEPNLGLLCIAAALRERYPDWTVRLLDLNVLDREIRSKHSRGIDETDIDRALRSYEDQNVRLVGLSFMTASFGVWGPDLVKRCRRAFRCPVVLGGIHPTVRPVEVFEQCGPSLSAVVLGEGEVVFPELVRECLDGGDKFDSIPHVVTRMTLDRELPPPARLATEQLSAQPPPAYDLVASTDRPRVVRVYAQRGCAARTCAFCSVGAFFNGGGVRVLSRSAASRHLAAAVAELKRDEDVLVVGDLTLFDTNKADVEFVNQIHRMREAGGVPFHWWCQTRGDLVTKDVALLLKEAHCSQVAIGCEAGTDQSLKYSEKRETVERIKQGLKHLHDVGIETQCYWVIGLPGESEVAVEHTRTLILNYLKAGLTTLPHITVLVPYPNTPIATSGSGIKVLDGVNWGQYWMNCDRFGCARPVYNTTDVNGQTLLTAERIWQLWRETITEIAHWAKANPPQKKHGPR